MLDYTTAQKSSHNQNELWNMDSLVNKTRILNVPPISKVLQVRYYSSERKLTHVDDSGRATMVDVGDKPTTVRIASAAAVIDVGPEVAHKIQENTVKKGDVLTVAQLAGILAAKKTSELIPLSHTLSLSRAEVSLRVSDRCVYIVSEVKTEGKTGVEMEALAAVSVAALTVYDMCKALSHEMVIKDIRLLKKIGGKTEFYVKDYDNVSG